MASTIVEKYVTTFNPRKHVEVYNSADADYELKTLFIDFLHGLFKEGKLRGSTLLDLGSGATIKGAISASNFVPKIYLSDLLESSREELQKWLNGDQGALDHSWELKHVAKLEGHNDDNLLESRIRRTVKGVLPCNILQGNPLHPYKNSQFDIVTSSFCLDCVPYRPDYFDAVKNMASLVRPGGRVALVGCIFGVTYRVGNFDFPCNNLDVGLIKRAMAEAGFQILEFKEHMFKDPLNLNLPAVIGGCFTALLEKL